MRKIQSIDQRASIAAHDERRMEKVREKSKIVDRAYSRILQWREIYVQPLIQNLYMFNSSFCTIQLFLMMLGAIFVLFIVTYLPSLLVKSVKGL